MRLRFEELPGRGDAVEPFPQEVLLSSGEGGGLWQDRAKGDRGTDRPGPCWRRERWW
jgi:hypothetical protein